jgi:hypothetical protein
MIHNVKKMGLRMGALFLYILWYSIAGLDWQDSNIGTTYVDTITGFANLNGLFSSLLFFSLYLFFIIDLPSYVSFLFLPKVRSLHLHSLYFTSIDINICIIDIHNNKSHLMISSGCIMSCHAMHAMHGGLIITYIQYHMHM